MGVTPGDRAWLTRALLLAEEARRTAPPNPHVGCVLVAGDAVVGQGFTQPPGGAHAEAVALAVAGAAARGATAYVTLEPCAHHGRTPPCADALLAAGVVRVVAAQRDPFPAVDGAGFARLEAGGAHVDVLDQADELAVRARRELAGFRTLVGLRRPHVTYKAAQTIDGRTATLSGDSRWISGPESRRRVHEWRAAAGVVLVGIGTALADDPELTARNCAPPAERQPLRAVADRAARLPLGSRLVATRDRGPVLCLCAPAAPAARRAALEAAGVETLAVDSLQAGLEALGARELSTVLCEGGPELAAALQREGLLDRIAVFVAPLLLGDPAAPGLLGSVAHPLAMAQAFPVASIGAEKVGRDILLDSWLREPP